MKRVGRDLLSKLMQSEAAVFEREAKQLTRPLNTCKVSEKEVKGYRCFSTSRFALSTSTEAKVNAIPNYVLFGGVGALGAGTLAYLMSSQPTDSTLAPVITKADTPLSPAERSAYGDFDVLDHMGMHFTQDTLLGNFAVLFFGSVDAPGRKKRLLQMAEAVMESDRKSNMHYLIPIFATLTPDKDDVIKLNAMVEDYATALNRKDILHVRLKAVTGDDNHKLHAAAQSYTAKVKGKEGVESKSSATQHDEGDLYFVNPEGEFIASYGPLANSKEMGKDFSDVMKAYKQSHPSWLGPKAIKTRHA